ncbi:hypothetical protein SAMN07250955_1077 [Arboricoccus pini]|uniref:Uncharacterized protein n=1 Tax=Arboricoccus pini TaxID=1963835 RepID=A0A212RBV2_9PROT|nr:hypothetical protein SAMN07250955_1077 [Arboricoccus pini]
MPDAARERKALYSPAGWTCNDRRAEAAMHDPYPRRLVEAKRYRRGTGSGRSADRYMSGPVIDTTA